ncbi:hypothetical protein HCN44_004633 [Aphidius gifuensis]|uniref:Uncharacterized protein n=1 Tax=Aphidius gifuensis TaxID=684658 RepID=A0A834Y246_APHGI|nr:uncharacterized protein LOC122848955 [Aphidius gifuensis]KAF7995161.1 hypothetical protein HCN44_004633 [Aphidius gifuensis]
MQQHIAETLILNEEKILEAIDQLRRRKARPDSDRICHYLLKKYSVDAKDTIDDLHRLVESEKVIQVDYKGNKSYRNALNWTRLQLYKNRPDVYVKEKLNLSLINESITQLLVKEPDYLYQGVPSQHLLEQLINHLPSSISRKTIEEFLIKQVTIGNIAMLTNGNYSLVSDNDKNNRRYSSETSSDDRGTNKTSIKSGNSPEYPDDIDSNNQDSRSNTSRQQSPTSFDLSKDHDSSEESNNYLSSRYCNIINNKQTINDNKKRDLKDDNNCYSNLKRSSKSERKQRLQVRADDSMDLDIDFEEFERSAKELKESLKKCREVEEQYSDDNKDEDEAGRSSTNTSPTPSNNISGSGTGGGRSARRKRARKVFDPSDNNVVKRKRGRQSTSIIKPTIQAPQEPIELSPKINNKDGPNRQCSICTKDKPESLVACRDCTLRAHPSCIYSPEELLLKTGYSWQCARCKTCVVCSETTECGNMVSCMNCNDAYHHSCHIPKIPSKSSTKWKCCHCSDKYNSDKPDKPDKPEKSSKIKEQKEQKDFKEMKELKEPVLSIITSRPDTPTNPSTLPPVLSPQVSPTRSLGDSNDLSNRDSIDPNIPDASDWTSEQVYQYFARLFGPKEAEVFRVQDIDGHSLLLMKRSDVLIGMDLLLGPALKIYRHVLKLQMRRDDTKFYWL